MCASRAWHHKHAWGPRSTSCDAPALLGALPRMLGDREQGRTLIRSAAQVARQLLEGLRREAQLGAHGAGLARAVALAQRVQHAPAVPLVAAAQQLVSLVHHHRTHAVRAHSMHACQEGLDTLWGHDALPTATAAQPDLTGAVAGSKQRAG